MLLEFYNFQLPFILFLYMHQVAFVVLYMYGISRIYSNISK